MDEFRHRSFAQVCRAEANVSPSAPHRTRQERRDLVRGEGRKEVQGGKRLEWRGGRKKSRTRLTLLKRANPPQPLRTLSPFRQFSVLARNPSQEGYASRFESSFGNYYDPRYTHDSSQLDGHRNCMRVLYILICYICSYMCFVVALYVNKERPEDSEDSELWWICHSNLSDKWRKCVHIYIYQDRSNQTRHCLWAHEKIPTNEWRKIFL